MQREKTLFSESVIQQTVFLFITFHTTWLKFSFKNLCITYSLYIY